MRITKVIIKAVDRGLSILVLLSFLILMIFGIYSVYDINRLFNSAAKEKLQVYKPEVVMEQTENGHIKVTGKIPREEISERFKELNSINEEVIGWISIDETGIDYPLCQAEDNAKYINTDALGEFSLSGAIFLDYRNNSEFKDSFNMVYGHHMSKGTMFSDIVKFMDDEYFTEHESGSLIVRNGDIFKLEFFACLKTTAFDRSVYSRYPLCDYDGYDNKTDEEWTNYIEENALQYRKTNKEERVIALSTCTNTENNGRVVLLGYIHE